MKKVSINSETLLNGEKPFSIGLNVCKFTSIKAHSFNLGL